MHRSYVNFFVLIFIVPNFAVPITDCGSKEGKLDKISLSCPGDSECILKRGQNVSISIQFTPLEDVPQLTAVVHGIIQGIPVPFPLPNPDACKDSNLKCPLKKGIEYNYKSSLFVRNSYPKIHCTVKWELKDSHSEDILCALIPSVIR